MENGSVQPHPLLAQQPARQCRFQLSIRTGIGFHGHDRASRCPCIQESGLHGLCSLTASSSIKSSLESQGNRHFNLMKIFPASKGKIRIKAYLGFSCSRSRLSRRGKTVPRRLKCKRGCGPGLLAGDDKKEAGFGKRLQQ